MRACCEHNVAEWLKHWYCALRYILPVKRYDESVFDYCYSINLLNPIVSSDLQVGIGILDGMDF